jgi:AraC family transcriptional regulator
MNYYYDAVLQAAEFIEDNLTKDIKVQDIVNKVGFSQFHFMRVFRSISGHTINNYIKRRKITEAAKMLLESNMRIIDIALLYGYNSQEAFTRGFKEIYNVTPHTYRYSKTP